MARERNKTIPKEKSCYDCGVSVSTQYSRKTVRCKLCLDRNWRQNNSKRYKESLTECRKRNGHIYYLKNKEYKQNRLNNDIEFRLKKNLRARISNVLKKQHKVGSSVRDLGCSSLEFKDYLELLWQPGMSWDNYGLKGWHIDHIKPLCKFDLTDRDQFKSAIHYTNLQPMWAHENWSKGGR